MLNLPAINQKLLYPPPRGRAERLIAVGRLVLAAFSLLAIWLDPAASAKHASTAYILLVIYMAYALLLVPLAWRLYFPWNYPALLSHGIDLIVFTALIYLTEGPADSPFFIYFLFALLAAALRWQWQGILWTTLVVLPIFTAMGVYAVLAREGAAFALNRHIIRSVYLGVMAIMLGYLSAYEQILRYEFSQLAAWPRNVPRQSLLRQALSITAEIFKAPRVLMIWEEAEEPWRYLALYQQGELHTFREAPAAFEPLVDQSLTSRHFLCRDVLAPVPKVLHGVSANFHCWRGLPLHPDLQRRFAIGSVLSLCLSGENVQGRLFILDKTPLTSDDLMLAEVVVQRIMGDIEQSYQRQRLQQATATEERIRLARDLHDGVLQSLTGVSLQLQMLQHLMEKNLPKAREQLHDLQKVITAEQRELRAFLRQLKPVPLELPIAASTLEARIEALSRKIERQWANLRVALELHLREPLPAALAHDIYRLVQEALVNAARHSRASTAQVTLRMENAQVHLTVTDNGGGFPFYGRYDLEALAAAQLGPKSLKGRVAALGGEFFLDSSDSGARLDIVLPLEGAGDGQSFLLDSAGHSPLGRSCSLEGRADQAMR
jgi:signal transduction histidine kinase